MLILIIWSIVFCEENWCCHVIHNDTIAIIHQLLNEQLVKLPAILDSFLLV